MDYPHEPVLVSEVIDCLESVFDGVIVDGTAGSGGHSVVIGQNLKGNGRLVCLDRDPDAIRYVSARMKTFENRVSVIRSSYADLDQVLMTLNVEKVNGVLLDLGMSSYQLDISGRGFSFNRDEPLDMRMDPEDDVTAYELINGSSEEELANILKIYGEEKKAWQIARAITRWRSTRAIETSAQLAGIVKSVFPPSARYGDRHPATRTFQALRIAVNNELKNIEIFLNKIPSLMAEGGRLVILSYHSLEDRLVKQAMVDWEKQCICPREIPYCVCEKVTLFKRLFRKAVRPGQEEINRNPRARSVSLRAAERI